MNNMGANPMFNNYPIFPMPQFPFPQFPFPNFNFYPNLQPNYQQGNLPYPTLNNGHPMPPTSIPHENTQQNASPIVPENTQSSTINRVDQNNNNNSNNGFSTNNFFQNTDDRQWSIDQEQQWQATTKKPFFENTVPGCFKKDLILYEILINIHHRFRLHSSSSFNYRCKRCFFCRRITSTECTIWKTFIIMQCYTTKTNSSKN
jgi:hypothetical protein